MSDCGCEAKTDSPAQRKVLSIALGLNATMFVVGLVAGLIGQSSGLIADSLDMFADAVAYGIALSAFQPWHSLFDPVSGLEPPSSFNALVPIMPLRLYKDGGSEGVAQQDRFPRRTYQNPIGSSKGELLNDLQPDTRLDSI
jgi:hypothetical protein